MLTTNTALSPPPVASLCTSSQHDAFFHSPSNINLHLQQCFSLCFCCRCHSHCPPPHILLSLPLSLLPSSAAATSSITSSSLPLLSLPPQFHHHLNLFSPWMHCTSCMDFGVIITRFFAGLHTHWCLQRGKQGMPPKPPRGQERRPAAFANPTLNQW